MENRIFLRFTEGEFVQLATLAARKTIVAGGKQVRISAMIKEMVRECLKREEAPTKAEYLKVLESYQAGEIDETQLSKLCGGDVE